MCLSLTRNLEKRNWDESNHFNTWRHTEQETPSPKVSTFSFPVIVNFGIFSTMSVNKPFDPPVSKRFGISSNGASTAPIWLTKQILSKKSDKFALSLIQKSCGNHIDSYLALYCTKHSRTNALSDKSTT